MPTYTFAPTTPCQQRSTYDDAYCVDVASYGDDWPFYLGFLSSRSYRYPYSTYTALYDIIESQADTYLTTTSRKGEVTTWEMNGTHMPSLSCPDCPAYSGDGGDYTGDEDGSRSDSVPYLRFPFSVTVSGSQDTDAYPMFPSQFDTRARYFIEPNQVLVGPLLTQQRTRAGDCAAMPRINKAFERAYKGTCSVADSTIGASSLSAAFGNDPTFLETSGLYRASNVNILTQLYTYTNSSNGVVYETDESFDSSRYKSVGSSEVNAGVPLGFWADQSSGGGSVAGFPIIFDININSSRADEFLLYLEDGGYLDSHTQSVQMTMIVFNPEMGLFALITVGSALLGSGGVTFEYSISPFEANKYDITNPEKSDAFRLFLELMFVAMLFLLVLKEFNEMYKAMKDSGPHDSFLAQLRGLATCVVKKQNASSPPLCPLKLPPALRCFCSGTSSIVTTWSICPTTCFRFMRL